MVKDFATSALETALTLKPEAEAAESRSLAEGAHKVLSLQVLCDTEDQD